MRYMPRRILLAAAMLTLCGCGGYLDQHPPNVRPESDAVALALGHPPQVADSQSLTTTPVVQGQISPEARPSSSDGGRTLEAPVASGVRSSPLASVRVAPPAPVVAEISPAAPPPAPPKPVGRVIAEAVPMLPPPPEPEPARTQALVPPPPAIQAPAPDPVSQQHCLAVAKQRSADAAANGLDMDTQRVVHDGTYANCMTWEAAHPPG
jgi:hypothetical protein